MKVFLLCGLLVTASSVAGQAAPRVLTDGQLEQSAAGAVAAPGPVNCLACGVRPQPVVPPVGPPPIVNPGRPDLDFLHHRRRLHDDTVSARLPLTDGRPNRAFGVVFLAVFKCEP